MKVTEYVEIPDGVKIMCHCNEEAEYTIVVYIKDSVTVTGYVCGDHREKQS